MNSSKNDNFFSQSRIWTFDGAVGTELYERGYFINRPFEELNRNAQKDVAAVHEAYIAAGAEVITTNTFAITRPQLRKFDIHGDQELLLSSALEIAARVARPKNVKVAFSMGPIGELVEPLGSFGLDEAKEEFRIAADIANRTGQFDFYALETFSNLSELNAAIDGIRLVDRVRPILASIAIHSSQVSILLEFAQTIGGRADVQALGLNCSQGPSDLLTSLQKLRPLTTKPIIVQPNAGVPRQINGRYFYMTSPDYLGKFAKRFIESGAQGVGGCCGTGPDHIRAVKSALGMAQARAQSSGVDYVSVTHAEIEVRGAPMGRKKMEELSFEQRPLSQIGQLLKAQKKVISLEVLPPKGTNFDSFLKKLEPIVKRGISFVNIPDGARASTRVSSLHASVAVKNYFAGRLHALPHFTTRDRNLIALQSDLLGASINGIHDLLLVTGDPPKLGNNKDATAVYDIDSIGLSYLANCLNHGVAPNGDELGSNTQFAIGVASNPTALNMDLELQRWNYKVASGADFAVTQPIFDADSFFRWKEKISKSYRAHLIGIWPLISLRNAEFMANEIPGVHVPKWVLEEMAKSEGNAIESAKRGVGIAQKVMQALEKECEGYCISAPLGKIEIALEVVGP